MNKRDFLKTGTIALAVTALSTTQISCGPKLSTWVTTIVSALNELKPLLPAQAALITKIIAVADDFDKAYRAGKFTDAATVFENLSTLIDQLIADVGVTPSQQVKIIIGVAAVALRAIAVILRDKAQEPAIAAAVAASAAPQTALRRLSQPQEIDAIFRSVQH